VDYVYNPESFITLAPPSHHMSFRTLTFLGLALVASPVLAGRALLQVRDARPQPVPSNDIRVARGVDRSQHSHSIPLTRVDRAVQDAGCKQVTTQEGFSLDAYIAKRWFVQQQQPITVRTPHHPPTHPISAPVERLRG
jgi:hypothetical protein